jgi:2-C-methyl-D-erythritol 4-phosphate cytidylyltransferase
VGGTYALLLAAGAGTRMGGPAKALTDLGGLPMFLRGYRSLATCPDVDGIAVLVPQGHVDDVSVCVRSENYPRWTLVVGGGETRQASVRRGLASLPEEAGVVLCHDAARPFATPSLVGRVIGKLLGEPEVDGVVPVVASPDTIKRLRDGRVVETLAREELGLVQTPQAFRRAALDDAHARAERSGLLGTDDAMLLEGAGYRVAVVEGEAGNFKITTPEDLRRAQQFVAGEATR